METQKLMNDISEGKVQAPVDLVVLNDKSLVEFEQKLDEFAKNIL
jgi:hypothetical protein